MRHSWLSVTIDPGTSCSETDPSQLIRGVAALCSGPTAHLSAFGLGVAQLSAQDLERVADTWPKHSESGKFSLEVFDTTGALARATLDERLAALLKRGDSHGPSVTRRNVT